MHWAVGNSSRQPHPAGDKGFPTKPLHSRDARHKVQGVKHSKGAWNIFQSVCNVNLCQPSQSSRVMKLPPVNEGVKPSFGTAWKALAILSLNTSPRAKEAINMWHFLPLVAGGLEMKVMESDPEISGNKRDCPGLPVPWSPRKPAQKRDHFCWGR